MTARVGSVVMELIWLITMSAGGLALLALGIGSWYAYCHWTQSGRQLLQRGAQARAEARYHRDFD